MGACQWQRGLHADRAPTSLASGQQGQMDAPALPALRQGDPQAARRALSHRVWIMHFCLAQKITLRRLGQRSGAGPWCELLTLPRSCCWGLASSC